MTFLKVLNGSQHGSVIELNEGREYSVGNDFNSDIFLDMAIDDNAVVTDENIPGSGVLFTIALVDNQVVCSYNLNDILKNADGEAILSDNTTSYSLPLRLNIGSMQLVITDDANAEDELSQKLDNTGAEDDAVVNGDKYTDSVDFGADSVSRLDENNKNITHILNEDGITTYSDDPLSRIDEGADIVEDNPVAEDIQLTSIEKVREKVKEMWYGFLDLMIRLRDKNRAVFYSAMGVVGFLLLVIIIIIIEMHQENTLVKTQERFASSKQEIQRKLFQLPTKYANLKLVDNSGNFVLIGVVASASDVTTVNLIFGKYAHLKIQVAAFDQIQPKIIDVLKRHNLPGVRLSFAANDAKILLSGLVNLMSDLDDAEIAINNQFPMVGELDTSQVFVVSDFNQELNSVLTKTGLIKRIGVNADYTKGSVIIGGYLTKNEIKQLQLQMVPLIQKYQDVVKFTFDLKDVMSVLPFQISEVYSGDPAYLVTQDGQKVFVGGSINGITLNSITQNQIIFGGKFNVVLQLSDISSYNDAINTTKPATANKNDYSNGGDVSYLNDVDSDVANDNNNSGGSSPSGARNEILRDEMQSEAGKVKKEKSELTTLKELYRQTKDEKIKQMLKEHMDNVEEDVRAKEHELGYYQQNTDSHDRADRNK